MVHGSAKWVLMVLVVSSPIKLPVTATVFRNMTGAAHAKLVGLGMTLVLAAVKVLVAHSAIFLVQIPATTEALHPLLRMVCLALVIRVPLEICVSTPMLSPVMVVQRCRTMEPAQVLVPIVITERTVKHQEEPVPLRGQR